MTNFLSIIQIAARMQLEKCQPSTLQALVN